MTMAYCYDGKTYETIKEMAEEYGIDRQRIYSFRRRGWSLEDAMQMCINDVRGRGRLFEYNGKLYRSPKALAEEYGLPWNSLAHYIQRCKTVEEAVDRCKEAQEKKIMLWGKRYQSRYEVAAAFGIRETSISARIHTRNRTLEEIVLEPKKCSRLRDVQRNVDRCSSRKCSKMGTFATIWMYLQSSQNVF